MSNRAVIILSVAFVTLIVAAAGGRFAWVTYQGWVDADPQTHFMLAAEAMEAYDPNRLSILLDKYPHLTSTHWEEDGTTLLHRAMLNGGDAPLASMLIDRGTGVNAVDSLGRTPLHALALCTDDGVIIGTDVVALLAESGADMNTLDHAGSSPLDLMPLERDVYSETFPEYFTTVSKQNRELLISYGAVE